MDSSFQSLTCLLVLSMIAASILLAFTRVVSANNGTSQKAILLLLLLLLLLLIKLYCYYYYYHDYCYGYGPCGRAYGHVSSAAKIIS